MVFTPRGFVQRKVIRLNSYRLSGPTGSLGGGGRELRLINARHLPSQVHPPWREKFPSASSGIRILHRPPHLHPVGDQSRPIFHHFVKYSTYLFTSVSTLTEVKRFHLSTRARARTDRARHRCHAFHASPLKHLPHFAPSSIRFLGLTSIRFHAGTASN